MPPTFTAGNMLPDYSPDAGNLLNANARTQTQVQYTPRTPFPWFERTFLYLDPWSSAAEVLKDYSNVRFGVVGV